MNEFTLKTKDIAIAIGVSKGRIWQFRHGWWQNGVYHAPIFTLGVHYIKKENKHNFYCQEAVNEAKRRATVADNIPVNRRKKADNKKSENNFTAQNAPKQSKNKENPTKSANMAEI